MHYYIIILYIEIFYLSLSFSSTMHILNGKKEEML